MPITARGQHEGPRAPPPSHRDRSYSKRHSLESVARPDGRATARRNDTQDPFNQEDQPERLASAETPDCNVRDAGDRDAIRHSAGLSHEAVACCDAWLFKDELRTVCGSYPH